MAKRFKTNYSGKWQMTLDRYMSGRFLPLFGWTLFLSTLAFLGIWVFLSWLGVDWTLGDAFIQLTNPSLSNNGIFEVNYAEWFAVIITNLFGLFVLNGIILTILVNWVSNRKDRHEKGEARYNNIFLNKFSVVIGGHKIVASLTRDLLSDKENDFILIQTQRDPLEVRKEIMAEVKNQKLLRNVVIYSGDRTSWHELEELHLEKAHEIYIIGENSEIDASGHDAINMKTWDLITQNIKEKSDRKIPCHIMFEYQSTFTAFQFTDIRDNGVFRFIPFSIYENWAQQLLLSDKKVDGLNYTPLDGNEGLSFESPQRVHLIVIGMSKMGMSLALEAAHIAHYPNFNNSAVGNPRTLITFIDKNARQEMIYLMGRFKELFRLVRWRMINAPEAIMPSSEDSWKIYDSISEINENSNTNFPWGDPRKDEKMGSPYFGNYLGENLVDIDFEFIQGDVALPSIQKYLADACSDRLSKTTIAVCVPDAPEALSIALYMAPSVYENVQQIWVQEQESGALVEAICGGKTGKDKSKFHVLRPFGMVEQCDYLVRIHSMLPKLVAYAYSCLDNKTSFYKKYQEDTPEIFMKEVEKHWLALSSEGGKSSIAKRWSNIYCANTFPTKKRSIGSPEDKEDILHNKEEIEALAKVEHNRWVLEQLLLGIRPVNKNYKGKLPVEDKHERTNLKSQNIHPDLISNDKLGSTQKYDEEIAKIIPLAGYITNNLSQSAK